MKNLILLFREKESFFEEMKKYKLKVSNNNYFTVSQNNPDLSFQKVLKFLKGNHGISALICCTEYLAAGALRACSELNLKIGKDISIITYDSLIVSQLTQPQLTSVSHPVKEMGKEAVRILLEKEINKNKNDYFLALPKIIDRGSVVISKKN